VFWRTDWAGTAGAGAGDADADVEGDTVPDGGRGSRDDRAGVRDATRTSGAEATRVATRTGASSPGVSVREVVLVAV
jgi:hypothetical protein